MRSNRLALAAVLVGSALLGFTSAGVTAIGGVAASTSAAPLEHQHHHHGGHRNGRGL